MGKTPLGNPLGETPWVTPLMNPLESPPWANPLAKPLGAWQDLAMSQLAEAQESLRDAEHQMRRSEHRGCARGTATRRDGWDEIGRSDELLRKWWVKNGWFI